MAEDCLLVQPIECLLWGKQTLTHFIFSGDLPSKAVHYMTSDNRPVCGFIADGYLGTWLLYFLHFFNVCRQYRFAAIYGDLP